MSLPLIALAIASFGIGTTEFVVMGLLPEVAIDLGVGIPCAGLVVTAYAGGVVIGAWIGSTAVALGYDYATLPWVGVVLAGAALAVALGSWRLEKGPASRLQAPALAGAT